MRRVLVMGCSGSGKSTFATTLAARVGLPYVSLDALFWKPGWVEPDKAEFTAKVVAQAEEPSWVIDGSYKAHAGELRRARADTVFFFDLPRRACLTGALKRVITTYGRVRPDMAPGCPERFDVGFLRWIWDYRAKRRSGDLAFLSHLRPDQRLITFAARRQADAYLTGLGAMRAH